MIRPDVVFADVRSRVRRDVFLARARDGGTTWSASKSIAGTADFSDHPILVSDGKHAYLSWLTHNEGYRLVSLEGGL